MTVPPEAALAAHDAGLCVVRVAIDGSKRPLGAWKGYQATRPERDVVEAWFPHPGIGVVCGAVSGGLEMLEFEGRAVDEGVLDAFTARCEDHDLGELLNRITLGYLERTPSGGVHLLYRCPDAVEGNLKLARRPSTPDELAMKPDEVLQVLVETRGEGGFVVVAPSNGATHPTGKPWELISGAFDTIATITPDERLALLAVARSFDELPDERPTPAPETHPTPVARPTAVLLDEQTPLGWYDENTTCDDVLERAGFTYDHTDAGGRHYTRPGKDRRAGTSATVWADNGTATLFSTSIGAPGEYIGNRNLRPSQLAAALLHGGDHSSLAREVAAQRPRSQRTLPAKPIDVADLPAPTPLPGIEGTTPPFPIHVLPGWIADPVRQVADGLQFPVDLPAAVALGCLATVTQGKVRVRLPGSAWKEHTNLFLAVAAPPGAGKSPAFSVLVRPVKALEKERQEAAKKLRIAAESRQKILEGRIKAAQAKAIKGDHGAEADAARLSAELDELEVPRNHQELADDATPEALADLIAANGGRLAVLSAEGQVFDAMAGQYTDRGAKANLDVYLKGFSGDSLRQNRIKREAVVIEECLLTICVTTQPAVLESLSAAPQLAQRGATARFMYAVPPVNVGSRDRSKVFASIDTADWDEQILAIGRRFGNVEHPLDVWLDDELVETWREWDQAIEERCAPRGDLAPLAEWIQKLRSCVLRVSGLLAVAEGRRSIDADVLARAFEIGDYWIEHAKVVHAMWGIEADLGLAKRILSWVQRSWLPAQPEGSTKPLRAREIHRAVFTRVGRVEELEEPLTMLCEHGWLVPLEGLPIRLGKPGVAVNFVPVAPEAVAQGVARCRADVGSKGNESSKGVAHVALSREGGGNDPSSSSVTSPPLPPPPATARHARQVADEPPVDNSSIDEPTDLPTDWWGDLPTDPPTTDPGDETPDA